MATLLRNLTILILSIAAGASTGFLLGHGAADVANLERPQVSVVRLLQSRDRESQLLAVDIVRQANSDKVVDRVLECALAPSFSMHPDYSRGVIMRRLQRYDTPLIARAIIRKRDSLDSSDLRLCANLLKGKSDFESLDLLLRMANTDDGPLRAAATEALGTHAEAKEAVGPANGGKSAGD